MAVAVELMERNVPVRGTLGYLTLYSVDGEVWDSDRAIAELHVTRMASLVRGEIPDDPELKSRLQRARDHAHKTARLKRFVRRMNGGGR